MYAVNARTFKYITCMSSGVGRYLGMEFGTGMRPKVQIPTQSIYMGSSTKGPNHMISAVSIN